MDWTKNLVVELGLKRGENTSYIADYVMDRGFSLEKIQNILMEQENKQPGRIYLGSINVFFGENPKL